MFHIVLRHLSVGQKDFFTAQNVKNVKQTNTDKIHVLLDLKLTDFECTHPSAI